MGNGKHLGVHGLMILVVFSWGMAWAVGRILALGLPPMTGAWLRYVLTMVLFYAWFAGRALKGSQVKWLPSGRQTWRTLTLIAVTGVLGYQLFFMNGMSLTAAGDASLIITFNPIFTVLLAAPIIHRTISRSNAWPTNNSQNVSRPILWLHRSGCSYRMEPQYRYPI